MLDCIELGTIVDIGCGDGYFLSKVIEKFPEVDVVASDLSEIAIDQTVLNLDAIDNSLDITTILEDAYDVKKWSAELLNKNSDIKEEIVISIWYVLHEVSQGKTDRVVKFLKEIYEFLPKAQLIIGEITRVDDELLSRNRYHSLLPEFQFFHDISKQGILSWEEYQLILKDIPYSLKAEKLFDPILDDVEVIPTSFIWHLSPK